jgi:outer membrane protein TolC
VVRRLAANPGETEQSRPAAHDQASLEETVAGLERELATAWTRHGTLTAENVKLRQQLREAQRNLEVAQRARRLAITDELNRAEAVLLDRLLSPAPETEGRQSGASA